MVPSLWSYSAGRNRENWTMTPTLFESMFEINVAIILVAVSVAMLIWFRRSLVVASARRMMRMMTRADLGPAIGPEADPQTGAVMKEARRRCRNCMHEGLCDRWLAGEIEGSNSFCPNARVFRALST
jgi:hypothetical protein